MVRIPPTLGNCFSKNNFNFSPSNWRPESTQLFKSHNFCQKRRVWREESFTLGSRMQNPATQPICVLNEDRPRHRPPPIFLLTVRPLVEGRGRRGHQQSREVTGRCRGPGRRGTQGEAAGASPSGGQMATGFSLFLRRGQKPVLGFESHGYRGYCSLPFRQDRKACYFLVQNLRATGSVLSPGRERNQPSLSTC